MNQVDIKATMEAVNTAVKRFFTVKKFANHNKAQGCWPDSDSAIWALRAGAPENGFADAFVTIGRRVLVDEEKFWKAIALLQEVKNVSGK